MNTSPSNYHSAAEAIFEELSNGGMPALGAAVEKLLNVAILIEREFLPVYPSGDDVV